MKIEDLTFQREYSGVKIISSFDKMKEEVVMEPGLLEAIVESQSYSAITSHNGAYWTWYPSSQGPTEDEPWELNGFGD